MQRKKVFFVSYGGGHANIVQFVYKELVKRGEVDCEILALTASGLILDKAEIPYKTLRDYIDLFEEKEIIKKYGENLVKTNYNKESGIPYEDILLYLGFGFWDLVKSCGDEQAAYDLFEKKGRTIFEPLHTMRKIISIVNPDEIVLTCGVRMEKAAGLVANEKKIPLVRIVDLYDLMALPYDAHLCVMNEYAKEIIKRKFNLDEEQISVTGQPVFENNLYLEQEKIEDTKIRFHVQDFHRVVLILESPGLKDTDKIEKEVFRLAQQKKDFLFIIKLHPNQNMPEVRCEELENVVFIKNYELKSLIAVADVALTEMSTSGIEAALMGKPLIVVNEKDYLKIDFSSLGIAYKAESIEKLGSAIELVTDNTSTIAKNLAKGRERFSNKENATRNVVDVIMRRMLI